MQNFQIASEQGVTVVALGTDYHTIYEVSLPDFEELLNLANSIEPPLVLLDLGATQYFGSAFLAFLVRLSNRLTVQRSGRLGLCQLSKFCHTVITASKLNTLFDLYELRSDGISGLVKETV